MGLDIWPGHTFSILKHSICSVRRGLRLSLFLSLTTNKKKVAVGRQADMRIPAGWLPTWDAIGPFHGLPHMSNPNQAGSQSPSLQSQSENGKGGTELLRLVLSVLQPNSRGVPSTSL